MDDFQMETPDFIKSLFDEDSGLGMDFDHCNDSPSFLQTPEILFKRKRQNNEDTPVSSNKKICIKSKAKKGLKKCLSFDEESLSRKDSEDTVPELLSEDISVDGIVLTGDGTKECCLPTVQGRFHDLRYIASSTMKDVLNGRFDDVIESYRIIDCRYSYEFEGGHIRGAENINNKDEILHLLKSPISATGDKRHILIFHCEFSSERGPKMCRFYEIMTEN